MQAKLTLTIDDQIIEQAKLIAREKRRSVSSLVEEYLGNLSANNPVDISSLDSPVTNSLCGMFSDNGKPYKEMLEDALSEKYL